MENRNSICRWLPLVCTMLVLLTVLLPAKVSAATGVNVDIHTQAEIKAYYERIEANSSFDVTYEQEPVTTGPNYNAGKLSQSTLQGAVDMLNFMRYIAGIPYDVQLNDSYNQMAQAGALVNAVNDEVTHYPAKPQDMEDSLYQLGYKGCSSSNLFFRSLDFRDAVEGWVSDEYNASGSNPGQRRWCLNPTMTATGFGEVDFYSAMYAFDNHWAPTAYTGVAWPAQQMPTQFFNTVTPWSISFGRDVDPSTTSVTLTRASDGRQWNFDRSLSEEEFLVDNGGYGQAGCVVFQPSGIADYGDGDVYHVVVKEGASIIADYDVNFFSLSPIENIRLDKSEISLEPGKNARLHADISPIKAEEEPIRWASSDSSVVKVSKYGKITALKEGSAVITVSDNTGSVSATCTVSVGKKAVISKITSQKNSIQVTWKKQNADGYQVCYATAKSFKSYRTKTVSKGSSIGTTIKDLKKGKTYYVKVRAYKLDENSTKIYGPFSPVKTIKQK